MSHIYRTLLKRAGWSLMLFGVLDISMMIYRSENGVNAFPTLLSLGVIAGGFLLRGNLQVATWVTGFSAFYWIFFILSSLSLMVMSSPLDLWMTRFRLQPIFISASLIYTGAVVVYLPWLYCQLRHPQVVAALRRSGMGAASPMGAWIGGTGLGIILSLLTYVAFTSADATEALHRAQQQLGPDYNYRLTSIVWSGSEVDATVTAYNRHTVQTIEVEWTK